MKKLKQFLKINFLSITLMSFSFCFSQVSEFDNCDIKNYLINKDSFNVNYLFVNQKIYNQAFKESYCSEGVINIETKEGFLLKIKEEVTENKLKITCNGQKAELSFNEKATINFKGYYYSKKRIFIYFELKFKDCSYKLSLDFNDKKNVITQYDHFR